MIQCLRVWTRWPNGFSQREGISSREQSCLEKMTNLHSRIATAQPVLSLWYLDSSKTAVYSNTSAVCHCSSRGKSVCCWPRTPSCGSQLVCNQCCIRNDAVTRWWGQGVTSLGQVPEWGGSSLWWRNRPTTERRATQEVGAGLPSKLHLEDHFWRFWTLRMSIPALLPFKGVLDLLGIRMKEPNMIWDEIPLLEDSELGKEKVFGKGCMLCDGFPPVEVDRGVRMSVAPGADEASDQLPALLPPVWNIQVQLQQFLAVYSWCTKEFQSLPTMLPQNDGERLLQVLGKSNVLGLEAGILQCSCGSCIPSPNAWRQANCSVKHLP